MAECIEQSNEHDIRYTALYFGDYTSAIDGALNEYLDAQPPGASIEIATRQYYAVVRILAKHLSKAAHIRKLRRVRIAIDQ